MNTLTKKLLWVVLFAVAMAFLENAVVVYLRLLYYPQGFAFPLKSIPPFVARVEVLREAATVVMLLACGILAGNSRLQRFAFFVLAFAVWDFFYYVFLYLCLGWPQSLFTWDILFLIPLPWVGPVWAPCLLCLLMAAGSLYIVVRTQTNTAFRVTALQWVLMIGGATVCCVSFMWDYLQQARHAGRLWQPFSQQSLFADLATYVPQQFNTALFFLGFVPMCLSILINSLNQYNHENK